VIKPNRRWNLRHGCKLTVEFASGKGVTRNFSRSGIYFETDSPFTKGQVIEFCIVLEHVDPDRPVRLKCRGEIVRVEENDQNLGVAVAIDSYTFEDV
jgi:hypothetical protein